MKSQNMMLSVAVVLLRIAVFTYLVLAIWDLGEISYSYCYRVIVQTAMEKEPGRDISISYTKNMDIKELALLLEKKGLVEDATIFQWQLKVNKYDKKLESGSYILNTSMTPEQMMQILAGEVEE